jgi:NAD/NADP transhydrogenase beta subunit
MSQIGSPAQTWLVVVLLLLCIIRIIFISKQLWVILVIILSVCLGVIVIVIVGKATKPNL